jgi:hypothetical protein
MDPPFTAAAGPTHLLTSHYTRQSWRSSRSLLPVLEISLKNGKVNSSSRLRQYVSDFKDVFTSDGKFSFVRYVENLLSHNSVLKLHI